MNNDRKTIEDVIALLAPLSRGLDYCKECCRFIEPEDVKLGRSSRGGYSTVRYCRNHPETTLDDQATIDAMERNATIAQSTLEDILAQYPDGCYPPNNYFERRDLDPE